MTPSYSVVVSSLGFLHMHIHCTVTPENRQAQGGKTNFTKVTMHVQINKIVLIQILAHFSPFNIEWSSIT